MIGLWFVAHGEALRFFVLFTGALIESFVVNDVCDEHFFGKTESSDATQVRSSHFLSCTPQQLNPSPFCRSLRISSAAPGTVASASLNLRADHKQLTLQPLSRLCSLGALLHSARQSCHGRSCHRRPGPLQPVAGRGLEARSQVHADLKMPT